MRKLSTRQWLQINCWIYSIFHISNNCFYNFKNIFLKSAIPSKMLSINSQVTDTNYHIKKIILKKRVWKGDHQTTYSRTQIQRIQQFFLSWIIFYYKPSYLEGSFNYQKTNNKLLTVEHKFTEFNVFFCFENFFLH